MLRERTIGSANADRAAAFSELAERHLADSYRRPPTRTGRPWTMTLLAMD